MRRIWSRQPATTIDRRDWSLRGLLTVNWLFIAVGIALFSTLSSITTPHIWHIVATNTAFYDAAERRGLWINLGLYSIPLDLSVALALIRPQWWQRALLIVAFLPLLSEQRAAGGYPPSSLSVLSYSPPVG